MITSQLIAERLKKICENKGISVNKALSESGAGERLYYNMLSGSYPSIDKIIKLADYLELPINTIIYDDEKIETSMYLIAYIDILGTKNTIFECKNDKDKSDRIVKDFFYVYSILIEAIEKNKSSFKNFTIKYKIFSDNIILAIKYDEEHKLEQFQALSLLLDDFQQYIILRTGNLLRGAIVKGDLFINENFVIGLGLIDAYITESEKINFPCICINNALFNELSENDNFILTKNLNKNYKYLDFLRQFDLSQQTKHQIAEIINMMLISQFNKIKDEHTLEKQYWFYTYFAEYAKENKLQIPNLSYHDKFSIDDNNISVNKNILIKDVTDNLNVIGQINAPTTIHSDKNSVLSTQEQDFLRIYRSSDGKTQTRIMQLIYEFEKKQN